MGDETFQTGDHKCRRCGTVDVHGESFSGVLVNDVQQFEPPLPVGGLVELEVDRPHMVGMFGLQQGPVGCARTAPLDLGGRPPQAFFPPQTAELLVVDHEPTW